LDRAFPVRGFVRDGKGAPVARANVRAVQPGGDRSDVTTGDDGSFTIGGLRAGSVTLFAWTGERNGSEETLSEGPVVGETPAGGTAGADGMAEAPRAPSKPKGLVVE